MPPVQMLYVAQRLRDGDPGGGCAAVGGGISDAPALLYELCCRLPEPGGGDRADRSAARDSGSEHKHGRTKLLLTAASSAELKVFVAESLYIRLSLAIIAVPSEELEYSAHFASLGIKAVVNHIVLRVQGH